MKQKDYVSYDVAKLLKGKGYKIKTDLSYLDKDTEYVPEGHLVVGCEGDILAPTLWDAQKWLREKHSIDVLPTYDLDEETNIPLGYSFDIYVNRKFVTFSMGFEKYEQALNVGVKEALNLI